jgi:hypothetical protein
MKNILFVLLITCVLSCKTDDVQYQQVNVAIPILMEKSQFRSSVEILSPQIIEQAGKIYSYENYIFINDEFKGIHIIDNSNPSSPIKISYIKLPGTIDISIKNNYLYADSATDLVVFDMSNINNIQIVERLEDVFSIYNYQIPIEADYADYSSYNYDDNIIIGWEVVEKQIEINNNDGVEVFDGALTTNSGETGVGGSLARFQIVDNYLYTVGSFEMTIFNIQNLSQPLLVNTQYSGWNIETMFQADGYLYLGGTNGMYIYSLDNAESPNYISEFTHWEGCDPVVVDGNYAYLTLRGGNLCGQEESVLEIIDISDKNNPTLIATHILDNPYGLGFKNNNLFVCDGSSGLKVYDKTNPLQIELLQNFTNIFAKDIIPLNETLLMIGEEILYQYEYNNETISLISTLQLN